MRIICTLDALKFNKTVLKILNALVRNLYSKDSNCTATSAHRLCNYERGFWTKLHFKARFNFPLKLDNPCKEPPNQKQEKRDYRQDPARDIGRNPQFFRLEPLSQITIERNDRRYGANDGEAPYTYRMAERLQVSFQRSPLRVGITCC